MHDYPPLEGIFSGVIYMFLACPSSTFDKSAMRIRYVFALTKTLYRVIPRLTLAFLLIIFVNIVPSFQIF